MAKEKTILAWSDIKTKAQSTVTVAPMGEAVHVVLRYQNEGVVLAKGVVARTIEAALQDSTFRIKNQLPDRI